MPEREERFIPALGHHALTPLYDHFQKWLTGEQRYVLPLLEQARIQVGHRVLDVGCGTGTLAVMLARGQPAARVVGLDADSQVLAMASRKVHGLAQRVWLERAMASEIPHPSASFDRLVCSMMLHHLAARDKRRAAAEMLRVLRPAVELHVVDFGPPSSLYGRF